MAGKLAILHGWSDTSDSFHKLKDWLAAQGRPAGDIWLGDYISMDDDVRVEDVAKRMETVVRELIAGGKLAPEFDLIVHSTGALVAREWISRFYPGGAGAPVKRIVMLAPANFGSRLAAVGKSMIGRLTKGLTNRLQTGEEMLRALELASPYQWGLTARDLLARPDEPATEGPFGFGGIWPFVIIGTRSYDSGIRQIVNEGGSDGTIRVSAGNLNVTGMTVDFSQRDPASGAPPLVRPWGQRVRGGARIPLAVLPERDHSEITDPASHGDAAPGPGARLGQMILAALACPDDDAYRGLAADWETVTAETGALGDYANDRSQGFRDARDALFGGRDDPKPEQFHRYLQLLIQVRDDYGNPIDDYFLEFSDPTAARDASEGRVISFHRDVLESVHVNSRQGAYRSLYLDHTDLMKVFYKDGQELAMSITVAPAGRNVRFFESARIVVHAKDVKARAELTDTRFFRNQTHFIEIIVPRAPSDDVFRLTPNGSPT